MLVERFQTFETHFRRVSIPHGPCWNISSDGHKIKWSSEQFIHPINECMESITEYIYIYRSALITVDDDCGKDDDNDNVADDGKRDDHGDGDGGGDDHDDGDNGTGI